jgi:hypothetical protein
MAREDAGVALRQKVYRRLRPVRIAAADAIFQARAECERRGWKWSEPVVVQERLRYFRIHPNASVVPGGPWIKVDSTTGEVMSVRKYSR